MSIVMLYAVLVLVLVVKKESKLKTFYLYVNHLKIIFSLSIFDFDLLTVYKQQQQQQMESVTWYFLSDFFFRVHFFYTKKRKYFKIREESTVSLLFGFSRGRGLRKHYNLIKKILLKNKQITLANIFIYQNKQCEKQCVYLK